MTNWTPEQQAEHRALWVSALRSGQYKQGEVYLRKGDNFCCLGVACEEALAAGVIPEPERNHWGSYLYDGKIDVLPELVQNWLGLSAANGQLVKPIGPGSCGWTTVASLNDSAGWTFVQIADHVEAGGVAVVGGSD